MTTVEDLVELRTIYDILDGIPLRVPRKKDTPNRLPKGYVTLFLENFKFGMKLPLQPYFIQMLGGYTWLLVNLTLIDGGYFSVCSFCGANVVRVSLQLMRSNTCIS